MGLSNHCCDSCNLIVDVLFPLAMLDETPAGIDQMVKKWYCIECKKVIELEAEEMEDDDTGEEPKPDKPGIYLRHHVCGCAFHNINITYRLWMVIGLFCKEHELILTQQGANHDFNCGCTIRLITNVNSSGTNIYKYIKVCLTHEQEK